MFDTGAQLRKVRKKANLTLDQLAGMSGIDRGTISRIELGHVSPRIDTIDCLCRAMKTTLPLFFQDSPNAAHPMQDFSAGPQAGPLPSQDLAPEPQDADAYWPVPTSVWQSLVEVVERFEAILSNSGELVLVLNRSGRILYLSPGGEHLLGYKRAEILGTSVLDLVHREDQGRFSATFGGEAPGSANFREFRLKHKHGHWARFYCSISDHLHSPSIRAVILNASLLSD